VKINCKKMAKQQEIKKFSGTVKSVTQGEVDKTYGTKYEIGFEGTDLVLTKNSKGECGIKSGDKIQCTYKHSFGENEKGKWDFKTITEYEIEGADQKQEAPKKGNNLLHDVAYINAGALASACDMTLAGQVKTVEELRKNFDDIRVIVWDRVRKDLEALNG
jgi:hypothetical protein